MATPRVLLIHWNAAEARERVDRLKSAGYEADSFSAKGGEAAVRSLRENPPDAFVIDLARLPGQGRAVATVLRQRKATRGVPIVFVGGDPEKIAQTRKLLPDAVYTEWARIRGDLRRAIAKPPAKVVVPGMMDGYSGTPLPTKLGIRDGSVVALLGAPADFVPKLGALPENVRLQNHTRSSADRILLFTTSRADLERRFPSAERALAEKGGLWIIWPKKASGVASDLSEPAVRAFGLGSGMVDYKICAVDETWSGLLFARRRK